MENPGIDKFRKLEMHELGRLSPEMAGQAQRNGFVFVLDNLRSLNNVGSVFRTGDAFRIEKLILTGSTGTPPHRDIHKTALGATETVAWEYEEDVSQALVRLKAEGYCIIALEQTTNSTSLDSYRFEPQRRYAVILGNEVFGVSDEALEHCDLVIEIPQFGAKHSLNVAVSAGVVAWEWLRQSIGRLS